INLLYTQETKKIEQLKALEAQKTEMLAKAEITAALIERVPRSILLAEIINRMPEQLTLTDLELNGKRVQDAPQVTAKSTQPARARSLAGKGGSSKGKKSEPPPAPKPVAPRYDFQIVLEGLAANDAFVADYHTALKQCPLLENVELLSTAQVKIDDTIRRKFKIEATIRPSADARNIKPLKIPRNDPFGAVAIGPDGKPVAQPASWTRRLGFLP